MNIISGLTPIQNKPISIFKDMTPSSHEKIMRFFPEFTKKRKREEKEEKGVSAKRFRIDPNVKGIENVLSFLRDNKESALRALIQKEPALQAAKIFNLFNCEEILQYGGERVPYNLGMYYLEGRALTQSDKKALLCFQVSANRGFLSAGKAVLELFKSGRGLGKSDKKLIDRQKTLALQGDYKAQNDLDSMFQNLGELYSRLGILYYNERQDSENEQRAFHYFTLAARQKVAAAHYYLGLLWEEKGSIAKAFNHFSAGEKLGNYESIQKFMVYCYKIGMTYFKEQDMKKAFKFFDKSAAYDYPEAIYAQARMTEEGLGVSKDRFEALLLYDTAAEGGSMLAQRRLGYECLKGGNLMPQNFSKALDFFTKAANQGDVESLCFLAEMHYKGLGVPRSETGSHYYLRKAANLGSSQAKEALHKLKNK